MASTAPRFVLDPAEFRLLEGLRPNPRKTFTGRVRGERLTRQKGISIEFADFRDYVEGDDLRHLDWNALARLDTTVVKTYQDEEDLAVHVLLDCSASMGFGNPPKFETAQRVACALGYVALASHDALIPHALGARVAPGAPMRGRGAYPRLAQWVLDRTAEGKGALTEAVRRFAGSSARSGLVYLVSDGLDPLLPDALRVLASRGHELGFVHVLSREEADPDLEGDLRLLDAEDGEPVEITASGSTLEGYRQNLDHHCAALEAATTRHGGRYVRLLASDPLVALIRGPLRRDGWLVD
ncbi:MAG: DUF58 domain-containing protein [Fimbriimonadaceae bacterium]|nr:DUF58 domain-containing protein [Fimbriimonadaceae bacterium]